MRYDEVQSPAGAVFLPSLLPYHESPPPPFPSLPSPPTQLLASDLSPEVGGFFSLEVSFQHKPPIQSYISMMHSLSIVHSPVTQNEALSIMVFEYFPGNNK